MGYIILKYTKIYVNKKENNLHIYNYNKKNYQTFNKITID